MEIGDEAGASKADAQCDQFVGEVYWGTVSASSASIFRFSKGGPEVASRCPTML